MTRKFAIRLFLLLTVLFTFNACDDPSTPHYKETVGDYLRAFIEAIGSMGKESAVSRQYHSRITCEGIVNNERVQTTLDGWSTAAEAEADGYTRCTLCCEEAEPQSVYE